MPRPPRIHVAGALYHTIARGNGGQRTFLDEKDYQAFVDGLGELKRTTLFSLYAYCLMPNHFHLLIEPQRFPLSVIMQRLLTRYVGASISVTAVSGIFFKAGTRRSCVRETPIFRNCCVTFT